MRLASEAKFRGGRPKEGGIVDDDHLVIIWLIANNVGAYEPLGLDPVNVWTATLILAVALDLSGAHAGTVSRRER